MYESSVSVKGDNPHLYTKVICTVATGLRAHLYYNDDVYACCLVYSNHVNINNLALTAVWVSDRRRRGKTTYVLPWGWVHVDRLVDVFCKYFAYRSLAIVFVQNIIRHRCLSFFVLCF